MTQRQVEELLKHESFLRALARRLLRDSTRADDVVQEAWLVALRSDKVPAQVRRGWLAGIVRNLARRAHREDTRRTRRERVVARDVAMPSTDDLFTEQVFRRRIAQLVVDLPDHYREVVLLRYYDNLTPLLISRRLGLSASTVRTRLQRGLNRLRTRLQDDERAGRAPNGALGLLAAVAFPRRPAGAALGVKLPAAALLLGFGLLVLWRHPALLDREHARTTPESRMAFAPAPEDATAGTARATDGTRPPGEIPALLRGIVRLPAGTTNRQVAVSLVAGTKAFGTAVEAGKIFELPVDGVVWPLALTADHPETVATTVVLEERPREPVQIDLRRRALVPPELLQPARPATDVAFWLGSHTALPAQAGQPMRLVATGSDVRLEGVVWLPDDAASDPVAVDVSVPGGWSLRQLVPGNRRFSIRVDWLLGDPLPRALRVQASRDDLMPADVDVPVLVSELETPLFDFFELMLEPAKTLTGSVQLADAGPAAGATVILYGTRNGAPVGKAVAATTTDAAGRFVLATKPERDCYLVAAVEGYAPAGLVTDGTGEAAFLLPRGVSITGMVLEGGAGLDVRATRVGDDENTLVLLQDELSLRWHDGRVAWQTVVAQTDAMGQYEIGGLEDALYDVVLVGGDETQQVPAPGVADFAGTRAPLTIEVRAAGLPVAAQVHVIGEREVFEVETAPDGRLEFEIAPVRHQITVSAPGTVAATKSARPPAHLVFDLAIDANVGTLEIAPRGSVAPAVCDFRLAPAVAGGASAETTLQLQNGKYTWRGIAPGAYHLWALPSGDWLPAQVDVTVVGGVSTSCAPTLTRGGRFAIDLRTPDDAPAEAANLWVAGSWLAAAAGAIEITPDGLLLSEPLAPGHHVVVIEPKDEQLAPRNVAIEVKQGVTTRTKVVLTAR